MTTISSIPVRAAASLARSRTAGTVIRKRAPESLSCTASSSAVYVGLTVVLIPPRDATAWKATTYSGQFGL